MVNFQTSRIHEISMEPNTNKSEVYNVWSKSYDDYVNAKNYTGPREIVETLSKMILPFSHTKLRVLDFGCGTGLVGLEVQKRELPILLNGIDISPGMITKAQEKNCYQHLEVRNIVENPISEKYHIIVSCGVFLEGHAPISLLENLIDTMAVEGYLLFTIRTSYKEENKEDFRKYVLDNPKVKVMEQNDISYLEDVKCELFVLYLMG